MPNISKWLWRIGLLAIAAIWLYVLINFLFPKEKYIQMENSGMRGKVVNLKAITIGNPPEEGMDQLYKQLDELTIPELGCTLRFDFISWGDERKQINIATASGEYDFIPGGVFSDYRTLVSKNAFLNLNKYLYLVPELVKHYNSSSLDTLEKCEINGGLYGLPQYSEIKVKNIGEGFFYREDLRKQWGLNPITDLNSMEAYLYRAKQEGKYKEEPLITDNRIWISLWTLLSKGKYLELPSAMETPFIVVEADNPTVPVSRIETEEFKEVIRYIKKWYDDGIIASDMLVASDNEGAKGLNLMAADKKPCETNVPIWSCSANYIPELYRSNPSWEFGFFDYNLYTSRLYLVTPSNNSVISVSSKTSSPDIAVKLLEKLHTDKRYYNLLRYGVLGTHYEVSDGVITHEDIPTDNYFAGWTASADESLDYSSLSVNPAWQKEVLDVYDTESQKKAKVAAYNPLDGFNFNTTGILKTVNKIEGVKKELFQKLICGIIDDYEYGISNLAEELKEAGFENYLEKLSNQLKEFQKNSKK
jgi:ABC-type glycerol-3-phosphate transport system substrate-binding protein